MDNSLSGADSTGLQRDTELLGAMLCFEAALARAQAAAGVIPPSAAQSIIGTCKIALFDVPKIVREGAQHGGLAQSMVQNLKETVSIFNQEASAFVHLGCSSQEAIQTAMSILARQTLREMDQDIAQIVDVLLQLARLHADTPVLERVNFQSVAVSSFGWKCTQWVASLVRCQNGLRVHSRTALRVRWGHGLASGTETQGQASAILAQLSEALDLDAADTLHLSALQDWLALGCEVALLAGVLGKTGSDLACMGQHEVGEIAAPAAGFLNARTNAQRAPQQVAALLALASQSQEGAQWQVELAAWSELLRSTSAATGALSQSMAVLQVDALRMRHNVESLLQTLPQQTPDSLFDLKRTARAAAGSRKYLEAATPHREKMPVAPVQPA